MTRIADLRRALAEAFGSISAALYLAGRRLDYFSATGAFARGLDAPRRAAIAQLMRSGRATLSADVSVSFGAPSAASVSRDGKSRAGSSAAQAAFHSGAARLAEEGAAMGHFPKSKRHEVSAKDGPAAPPADARFAEPVSGDAVAAPPEAVRPETIESARVDVPFGVPPSSISEIGEASLAPFETLDVRVLLPIIFDEGSQETADRLDCELHRRRDLAIAACAAGGKGTIAVRIEFAANGAFRVVVGSIIDGKAEDPAVFDVAPSGEGAAA